MTRALFLGIDGGGTRCRARLADGNGRLLGEGIGGPANLRLGEAAAESILAASRAALAAAGLGDESLKRVHAGLGLAGAILREEAQALRARLPFATTAIDTDAFAAWLGAFRGGEGAILILGTGSCGFGVFGGEPVYVGGYGHLISDEGSGAAIGRESLRRALWAFDGRIAATPLSEAILARFGRRAEALVTFADSARAADFAELAPLVLAQAESGDPLGIALVTEAAEGAARIAGRLLECGAPALCLLGGLARPLAPWLPPPVRTALVEPVSDAMDGAILMARRHAEL